MLEPALKAVKVDSPVRFAIIGPGLPTPKVILFSGEQVSDLIGYYSIKEAGLHDVVFSSAPRSTSLFRAIFNRSEFEPYLNFDYWVPSEDGDREQLYSMIISLPRNSRLASRLLSEFSFEMQAQVGRAVKAFHEKRHEEVVYVGQMLATFVALFASRVHQEDESRLLRRQFLNSIYSSSFAIISLVVAMSALASAVLASGDVKSIIEAVTTRTVENTR